MMMSRPDVAEQLRQTQQQPFLPTIDESSTLARLMNASGAAVAGAVEAPDVKTLTKEPSNESKKRKRQRVSFQLPQVEPAHHRRLYSFLASCDPSMPPCSAMPPLQQQLMQPSLPSLNCQDEEDGVVSPASLWYSYSELVEMKRAAKRTCTTRFDLEFALNDAYTSLQSHSVPAPPTTSAALPSPVPEVSDDSSSDEANSSSSSSAEDAPSSFSAAQNSCIDTMTMTQKSAQRLLNIPFFREQRGMERWSSRRHALSRGLTVLQVKTEVFCSQAKKSMMDHSSTTCSPYHSMMMNNRNHHHHSHHHYPAAAASSWTTAAAAGAAFEDDQTADALANVCAAASAPAVRFAQLLGHIDAMEAAAALFSPFRDDNNNDNNM